MQPRAWVDSDCGVVCGLVSNMCLEVAHCPKGKVWWDYKKREEGAEVCDVGTTHKGSVPGQGSCL